MANPKRNMNSATCSRIYLGQRCGLYRSTTADFSWRNDLWNCLQLFFNCSYIVANFFLLFYGQIGRKNTAKMDVFLELKLTGLICKNVSPFQRFSNAQPSSGMNLGEWGTPQQVANAGFPWDGNPAFVQLYGQLPCLRIWRWLVHRLYQVQCSCLMDGSVIAWTYCQEIV